MSFPGSQARAKSQRPGREHPRQPFRTRPPCESLIGQRSPAADKTPEILPTPSHNATEGPKFGADATGAHVPIHLASPASEGTVKPAPSPEKPQLPTLRFGKAAPPATSWLANLQAPDQKKTPLANAIISLPISKHCE